MGNIQQGSSPTRWIPRRSVCLVLVVVVVVVASSSSFTNPRYVTHPMAQWPQARNQAAQCTVGVFT